MMRYFAVHCWQINRLQKSKEKIKLTVIDELQNKFDLQSSRIRDH